MTYREKLIEMALPLEKINVYAVSSEIFSKV